MTIEYIKGLSYWAKLARPVPGYNPDEREWTIDVSLDSENVSKMVRLGLTKGIKNRGDDRGSFYTFKRRELKKRDGKPNPPITVRDNLGKPWPADKLIGNGSKVEIKFNVFQVPAFAKLPAHNKDAILEVSILEWVEYVSPKKQGEASVAGSPAGNADDWKGDVV